MKRPVASALAVALTGLLAACSSPPVKKADPSLPPMSSADTASLLSSLASPQPLPELPLTTRSFLLASEKADTSALAWSFVLLPWHAVGKEGEARHLAGCKALRTALEQAEATATEASSPLMPVYWPLARDTDLADCAQLVENHDYVRARKLLPRPHSDQPGPLLAAWIREGNRLLVLDISRWSPQDIERALQFWTAELAMEPQYWNAQGIALDRVHTALAPQLKRNGNQSLRLLDAP